MSINIVGAKGVRSRPQNGTTDSTNLAGDEKNYGLFGRTKIKRENEWKICEIQL